MIKDPFERTEVNVNLQPKTGAFIAGEIIINEQDWAKSWIFQLKISNTKLSVWRNMGDVTPDVDKFTHVAELISKIFLLKNRFSEGIVDLGQIDSYDQNSMSTYQEYINLLQEELDVLSRGISLPDQNIAKILDWTINDLNVLSHQAACDPINFASSGFSIFLVSLMDIWGSIMNDRFGSRGQENNNVGYILKELKKQSPTGYIYNGKEQDDLVDRLRNNLVHNYGLRVFLSKQNQDWPTIDSMGTYPAINFIDVEKRWHMDCVAVKNDFKKLVVQWVIKSRNGAVVYSSRLGE